MTLHERLLLKTLCKDKIKEQHEKIDDCVHALANPYLSETSSRLIEAKLKYHFGRLSHLKSELKKQQEAFVKESGLSGETQYDDID